MTARSLISRFTFLALLTAVLSACQGDALTEVPRSETRTSPLDPAPLDTTIIGRSQVGDIALRLGNTRPGPSGGPDGAGPDMGLSATYTPLETTVVLYYVLDWLYLNGHISALTAIQAFTPVVDAYTGLTTGDTGRAITGFVAFVSTVTSHQLSGAMTPEIAQPLRDLALAAITQLVPPVTVQLRLDVVASGLANPLHLTAPANDPRLFIVTQGGTIRIVQGGQLLPTPFLDITSKMSAGGEGGLLSLAFHPSYATNGFFYVFYTNLAGDLVVERYTRSADANLAAPASAKQILYVNHPNYSNHNGGHLLFGPDGMLYIATGDGGGGGDPSNNAQNLNVLLGKLLRIDVGRGDPYAIPADNPFVGQSGARAEIWAYGLRNPWRNAFDRAEGRLYIADVGQSGFEEVNVVASAARGVNYGWKIMEGSQCYNASTCNQTGLTLPVLAYPTHVDGTCSITGGIVYRGQNIPELRGHYFYGDYCAGWVRSFRLANGLASDPRSWGLGAVGKILSFGEDAAGEMYLLSNNGSVYRFAKVGAP